MSLPVSEAGFRRDARRVRAQDDQWGALRVDVGEVQRTHLARIPLGRYGMPEEVGRVGAFLLSTAASYVNGVVVLVDGGMIRSLP